MSLAIQRFEEDGQFDSESIDHFINSHNFPLVEGNHVTFVYRGDADEVYLQHFIYGLKSSQPFNRLEGTDLWYQTMEIPPKSRVEYKFSVVYGERQQWIRDPLNPHLARDPFGANSVCQGEGYQSPDWVKPDPEARTGIIDDFIMRHSSIGSDIHIKIYLPARFRRSRQYPLLIVHDGFDYLKFTNFKTILDNLIHRLEIAPMVVAFIQSRNRLVEYAAHEPHADFVVKELLPLLETRLPLQKAISSRCLMGASFGGVASLSTAWYHQNVFGKLFLQSGSFAFTDIGHHQRSQAFDPVVAFVNKFRANPGHPAEQIYLSCGTYESLIYENRSMVPFLQQAGMKVRYTEARDGHNWENWRDRCREGLTWLFPGPLWMVYE